MMHWTIKTLWIGPELSKIEQLCLASYVEQKHQVELFVYDEVRNIPDGVKVRDGNELINESEIFVYKKSKSVSAFSNWFRYEMLYKEGGVWTDTDVICLKNFDFEAPLFFGKESVAVFNGAVIGAIPGQDVFKFLANQSKSPNAILPYDDKKTRYKKYKRKFLKGNKRGNIKWGEIGPRGFTKALEYFNLGDYGLPYDHFYPIPPQRWDLFFDGTLQLDSPLLERTYGLHLWNEMFRKEPGFDKNANFASNSLIEQLKHKLSI